MTAQTQRRYRKFSHVRYRPSIRRRTWVQVDVARAEERNLGHRSDETRHPSVFAQP